MDLASLSSLDALLRCISDSRRKCKYVDIADSRVRDIEFSLCLAFAQYAGLIPDAEYTHPDAEKLYAPFRKQFFAFYGADSKMNKDQRGASAKEEKAIMFQILRSASVVACTASEAVTSLFTKIRVYTRIYIMTYCSESSWTKPRTSETTTCYLSSPCG